MVYNGPQYGSGENGSSGRRALDSESRGPEFDPYWQHRVVPLSKTIYLPKVLDKTQEVVAPSRHD